MCQLYHKFRSFLRKRIIAKNSKKKNYNLLYTNYSLKIFLQSFDHVVIKVELVVPPKVLLSTTRHIDHSSTEPSLTQNKDR